MIFRALLCISCRLLLNLDCIIFYLHIETKSAKQAIADLTLKPSATSTYQCTYDTKEGV